MINRLEWYSTFWKVGCRFAARSPAGVVHRLQIMNYQEQYLHAVYADFQTKVRILADLIKDHPGEYGSVIENAVRDLLRVLLPGNCELGSGFVIDSGGNRSLQCDIVIYDSSSSFSVFGHGGQFLFPVESVHAVLQVTKTLTASKVRSACENIASVRRLRNSTPSSLEWHKGPDGSAEFREHYASPPVGIVIGYQSDTRQLKTIRRRFETAFAAEPDPKLHPDLAVSIREAFKCRYVAQSHKKGPPEFKFYHLPVLDKHGNVTRGPDGGPQAWAVPRSETLETSIEFIEEDSGHRLVVHPKHAGEWQLADDARLLMTTLGTIANLISMKRRTGVTPFEDYFSPYFAEAVRV